MAKDYSRALQPVELFGTILEERKGSYHFAPEDDVDRAQWLGKRVAEWDGLTMTIPRWLARKLKWIAEPPPDDHPAWWLILKAQRTFVATRIEKVAPPDEC